jgi:hypothetical protein
MAKQRRTASADAVSFTTYTLRWPACKWVKLLGLERHWERAEVHARRSTGGVTVTTRNVSAFTLTLAKPAPVEIDGQRLPGEVTGPFLRRGGKWRIGALRGLHKKPGVQGPIDDALFGPVLAVSGTGKPWSERLDRWSNLELQRFRDGWDEYLRGTLPERKDAELTDEDIGDRNLYLFGDPGSNAVLARILPKLPIRWTKDSITVAGRKFSTRDHLPMLVYPNPENPERYVVIGSGFTFSRADWQGSNARQYPHLPDYAVIRYDPERFSDNRREDTVLAGFFDERWRVPDKDEAEE